MINRDVLLGVLFSALFGLQGASVSAQDGLEPCEIARSAQALRFLQRGHTEEAVKYSEIHDRDVGVLCRTENGNTSSDLIYAVENGLKEYLFDVKIDPIRANQVFRIYNENGYNLLMVMVESDVSASDFDTLKRILDLGVDPFIVNEKGFDSVSLAMSSGKNRYVENLKNIVNPKSGTH